MREGISSPPEQEIISQNIETRVEQEARFEGNESELLFQRLEDPRIKNQLIDIYVQAYEDRLRSGPPMKTVLDDDGVFREVPYVPPSRGEIENTIDERIEQAAFLTLIDVKGIKGPCVNPLPEDIDGVELPRHMTLMSLQWKIPETNMTPTTKQWSIAEAHEKGHQIRRFGIKEVRPYFKKIFSEGFDIEQFVYTKEEYERDKKEPGLEDLTYEEMLYEQQDYLGDPNEIAERMSQLKNYFSMKDDEEFTAIHLQYAREHYVKDTGMDNLMTQFFRCVTLEKEATFLRLINSVGI